MSDKTEKSRTKSGLERDGYTIMVISHRGAIRQLYLPRKIATVLGTVGMILLVLFVYAAVNYSSLVVKASRVAALEERNRKLEERVAKVKELERRVRKLQEDRAKLYALLGADSASMERLRQITHQELSQNLFGQEQVKPSITQPLHASEISPPVGQEFGPSSVPNDVPYGLPVATETYRLTLGYGGKHKGVDIATAYNTPIIATADGLVKFVGTDSTYGLHIVIHHNSGYETLYAHLSHTRVQPGESVSRGQIIGFVGLTGHTSGPHVHYEVHKNGRVLDPTPFLYASR